MEEDMAEGMQCSDHPFRSNPHGICPLCLQDKLGKLLSSSLPLPPSSPPNHLLPPPPPSSSHRLPFLSTKNKHKNTPSSSSVFKRSKSTLTPRRGRLLDDPPGPVDTPRKRNRFWSFLHLSSSSSASSANKLEAKTFNNNHSPSGKTKHKCEATSSSSSSLVGRKIDIVVEDDDDHDEACDNNNNSRHSSTTTSSSFERKVSRSRSVGCGSRSFSGDFFERISTGFGDCALRRVESHREAKPKSSRRGERARCAGLFSLSGFILNSSSSSSSSSSYLVSSSNDDHHHHQTTGRKSESMALSQSRGKYWGWAFASPMRVFTTKPSNSKDVKNNATPNLSAIPSLLAVTG